ncbi:V-type ATPase 116kDa subunit family protein [Streptacidiphilus sp. ASG 303]|uniref:V-type ATPase 116kDa subunit family protein n=1 Tax=Streptacidiphilus sp. ASG 303 TaxID=2896847 RepID=UPI0021073D79|nr:V-type ATPase 116kDa subunit family protein [Streptacidiphilus sp. ASG 303]
MPWPAALTPVRMQRVAVVAPRAALRGTLIRLAEAGCVELDLPSADDPDAPGPGRPDGHGPPGPAARLLERLPAPAGAPAPAAVLSAEPPDLDALERQGRADLLAGEARLEEVLAAAVGRGAVTALAGWCPAADVAATAARLAPAGAALVRLPAPRGVEPPTQDRDTGAVHRSCAPLVRTYGTAPYADLDPSLPAGAAYAVMFGVMFGDAGHGALLLAAALLLRRGRPRRLARLRPLWPLVAGAGLVSVLAGAAYGEFFGPTGVLPVLWLDPLAEPVRLLAAAVGLGCALLLLAHVGGAVNRWREGGAARALYAVSGVAGGLLLLGLAVLAAGVLLRLPAPLAWAGAATAAAGACLAAAGLSAASGGGPGGAAQTGLQLFEAVLRTAANTVSFARLAAFGLTHAALGAVVWHAAAAQARGGPAALPAAVLLLVLGNALALALELLVAGVQALRLEFHELFSRVFEAQGRPFRPWRLPGQRMEVTP